MNNLFKIFLLIISFSIAIENIQSKETALQLNFKDGSNEKIFLSDEPTIKFINNDAIAIKIGTSEICYDLSNLKNYKFINHEASADNILSDSYIFDGNNIIVPSSCENCDISIYSIAGDLLLSTRKENSIEKTISLDNLNNGIYVIKIGAKSFKFIKQ